MKPASLLVVVVASVAVVVAGGVLWATHDTAPAVSTAEARPAAPIGAKLQACGKSVVEDWYDDTRVGKLYPLACYEAALRTIPIDVDISTAPEEIRRALDFARTGRLAPALPGHQGVFAVKVGMTRKQVRALAGTPFREGPHCWIYHATKPGQPEVNGMRICFSNRHVSLAQTSVHL